MSSTPSVPRRYDSAYTRITRHVDGTFTVRGFPGRVYRTIQGAKGAARWIEAAERRAKVAWTAEHGTARQRAQVRSLSLRTAAPVVLPSEDFDGAIDFGMVA
jgi:hypothetical protein